MTNATDERPANDSVSIDADCSGARVLEDLNRLAMGYYHDGDVMECKVCGRRIVATRWHEKMQHERNCYRAEDMNPWKQLMRFLERIGVESGCNSQGRQR